MADATDAKEGTEGQGTHEEQQTFTADEVQKLKDINQRLQGKLTDTEKRYEQVTSMYKDIDPDEVKALRQKAEDAERKAAERDPSKLEDLFERKRAKEREEYEGKISSRDKELEQVRRELKTLKVTDKVMTEIGTLFNADGQKFIKREVEERCELDEDGSIIVRGEQGEILYRGARPMTAKEFGEFLCQQYPSLAKSTATPGGKDVVPGQKVTQRVAREPETLREFTEMGSPKEVWDKLPAEKKLAFAQQMKVGGVAR